VDGLPTAVDGDRIVHSKKGEFHHMAQMQNAQSVALQLEKVRDKLSAAVTSAMTSY